MSSPKVVPLASKSDSCFSWSCEQLLQEFLEGIRTGTHKPVKLMLTYFEQSPDGGLKPRSWYAQITTAEEIALLELLKSDAIHNWRKS